MTSPSTKHIKEALERHGIFAHATITGGTARRYREVICSTVGCGGKQSMALGAIALPPEAIIKRFRQKGWLLREDKPPLCPLCAAGRRHVPEVEAQPESLLEGVVADQEEHRIAARQVRQPHNPRNWTPQLSKKEAERAAAESLVITVPGTGPQPEVGPGDMAIGDLGHKPLDAMAARVGEVPPPTPFRAPVVLSVPPAALPTAAPVPKEPPVPTDNIQPIRTPTPDQLHDIVDLLIQHFSNGQWHSGWSDEKVSERVDLPRAAIEHVREASRFGGKLRDAEVDGIRSELAAVEKMLEDGYGAMRAMLAELKTKADALERKRLGYTVATKPVGASTG